MAAGVSRRRVLRDGAGWAAAMAVPWRAATQRKTPPRNRITMGAIGLGGQGTHNLKSFLTCVRTRGRTIAPPEVAHRSTTTCHVTNICLRLGRPLTWDPAAERFVNDPTADGILARAMRSPWRL